MLFLSLLLRSPPLNRTRNADLGKMWTNEMPCTLGLLKVTRRGWGWCVNEVPERRRKLFVALGVEATLVTGSVLAIRGARA